MANSTAGTLIGHAESITSIDKSTIGIPGAEETYLVTVVDRANREYYSKFMLGGGEPEINRIAETGGTFIADTTVASAPDTGDTDVLLTSSNSFGSSGAAVIWSNSQPDYFEFTSNDTGTDILSGVTGVSFTHEEEDAVTMLYALPSNFESFRSTHDSPDGVSVNGIPYLLTSGVPVGNQFRVYDNGTKYLLFPQGVSGSYYVEYNKGATAITSINSVVDVPIGNEEFIVYRIVEHIFNTIFGMCSTQGTIAKQRADKCMLDALKRRNVGKILKSGRPWGNRFSYGRGYNLNESQNSL